MIYFIVLPHFGIKSHTLYLIPPQSHYADTRETSPSPTQKIRMLSGEQLVLLLKTLECRGPGSNPVPPDLGVDTLPTALPRPVIIKSWVDLQNQ